MKRDALPGFTIVELTIVLALVVVMMGLVVVRFNWGGPRDALIAEARKLGRLIATYREKAISEERPYALTLDLNAGRYFVTQPGDSNTQAVQQARPLIDALLPQKIRMVSISARSQPLTSPVTVYLDPHGIMQDLKIKLGIETGQVIVVHPDPLTNEVTYDER